ncbi:MAG: hypothetical protein WA121_10590 [Syntrophales bacterium]
MPNIFLHLTGVPLRSTPAGEKCVMPKENHQIGGRTMDEFAAAGSQRWLQIAINRYSTIINSAFQEVLGLSPNDNIDWASPLRADQFKEYRDMEALRRLGVQSLSRRKLREFWPNRGPVWDALARTTSGELIFVEAKAHIAEAASPGTKASMNSLELIKQSLAEARRFYAPKATAEWSGIFYQYANRLAHHYLFRELNQLPSHLVFLYFINAADVGGPGAKLEWQGAIQLLHAALGLAPGKLPHGVHEVFLDASVLKC